MFAQTALSSVDSYKLGHADQYPPNTTKVYCNFTARSMKHLNVPTGYKQDSIVWFGLQGFLKELNKVWETTFFSRNIKAVMDEAKTLYTPFCGPNGFNTSRLEALHNLGYLPLEIKALPEGAKVPIGVPVLTITNTHPDFYWLPNFLETWISAELWKSSTSATVSQVYRKILNEAAETTGGSVDFIGWQGHDFSTRGMSGIMDAAKSGAGHLLSFTGTDNISAVQYINWAYKGKDTFVGGSVPATEHSVMCAGGKGSEIDTFRRILKTYPSGVVSIVSDTWDFWKVITELAIELKSEIMSRVPDSFGLAKTVFRPDSGDPVKIICGYLVVEESSTNVSELYYNEDGMQVQAVRDEDGKIWVIEFDFDEEGYLEDYTKVKEISSAEALGAVEALWNTFGGTVNAKGFKTLDPHVGLIYGDSITPERASTILTLLAMKGFASDNIVFGIGSYTFQYQTRDSLGFAMKATYVEIEGHGKSIFKSPKTDDGTKKSATGLLRVNKTDKGFCLEEDVSIRRECGGYLATAYLNGEVKLNKSFADIRSYVEQQ